MHQIRKERFEALVGYSRLPHASMMSLEVEWWASDEELLLGTVLHDFSDSDFLSILLGRDADSRYRCIDVTASYESVSGAREALFASAQEVIESGQMTFPQGDERGKKIDIFQPIHSADKLNVAFERVRALPGYSSARGIIAEAMHHYVDVDGNFIEQFQTTGFDSRLWELYLFAYLTEERLLIDRSHSAPDFLVSNGECVAAIEAVTVQASQDGKAEEINSEELTPQRIQELQRHYMPIKFGSPLYSKLKKKYWSKEHVAGRPLIFAIADFHASQSMMWSSTALHNYLYGVRHDFEVSPSGELIISPIKIEFHEHNGKRIPSGFFFTDDAENVSAVLFSATGTISKFIRMGKVAGFGDPEVKVLFTGTCHKYDPNAALPDRFLFEVDEQYIESWGEGISVFHNPNAKHPIPREMFPGVAHHYMQEDGQIVSFLPEFHPYGGLTIMIQPTKDGVEESGQDSC